MNHHNMWKGNKKKKKKEIINTGNEEKYRHIDKERFFVFFCANPEGIVRLHNAAWSHCLRFIV